jgi:E3 ubiquitin-protein ligase SHPRH
MESFGSYGSKIQALVRHLLFLQVTEPGAKSIVFSAWADSLHSESLMVSSPSLLNMA